jgi:hypothetical protein
VPTITAPTNIATVWPGPVLLSAALFVEAGGGVALLIGAVWLGVAGVVAFVELPALVLEVADFDDLFVWVWLVETFLGGVVWR